MDDTALGRPPRHERPRKTNEELTPLGDVRLPMTGVEEPKRIRWAKPCERCGDDVKMDITAPPDSIAYGYAAYRREHPLCPSCVSAADAEEERAHEDRERLEQLRVRLHTSGIPERWRDARWEEFQHEPERQDVIEAAKDWAEGRRNRGLLFHGPVGRGKTYLAALAAVHRLALGHVRWLSIAELMMDLRMPFGAPEYVRAQRALQPGGRPALILDDLDKLRANEMQLQPVYVAINGWVEADLPLLVTMNRELDDLPDAFGEIFGEAIASRLAGHCDIFELSGRDRRLDP